LAEHKEHEHSHAEHEHHEHSHAEHEHSHGSEHHAKKGLNALRAWQIAAGIFAIALIATAGFAIMQAQGPDGTQTSTSTLSDSQKTSLSSKAITYLQSNFFDAQGITVSLKSSEQVNNELLLLNLELSKDGQTQALPCYITTDGKKLIVGDTLLLEEKPATTPETPGQQLQKSDRPVVELFIMSHCPYGTQVEKGILPVVNLLGDKIDFSVKFVYYAMHGQTELQEQTRQYCIQKEQPEKFLPYLSCFLADGNSGRCIAENSIDTAGLNACTAQADSEFNITANFQNQSTWLKDNAGAPKYPLFDVSKEDNEKYGVGGSPTLVINGVQAASDRDSASLLKTICSGFNTEPSECSTQLSGATPSIGFGYSEAEAAASDAICGT